MINRLLAAAADRRRERMMTERESRDRPAPARDPRIRRPYTPREEAEMESVRSARYRGDDPGYHHGGRPDEGGLATMQRLGTIAPVLGNPSIDPAAGDLVAVSYMCGYADDTPIGHSAMEGVDRMVTGDVDASRELEVEGHHGGGPLLMSWDESIYDDRAGAGTHDVTMDADERGGATDWCADLRRRPDEGWL